MNHMSKPQKIASTSEIERAIADLIAFYEIGLACRKAYPGNMPPGVAKQLADQHGLHHEIIRLARRFASPDHGGYSDKDLNRLFNRARKHRCTINRTCVTKLLTVQNRTHRSSIELAMIREHWSRSVLDDHLRLRYGKRKHAGRRLRRAKNTGDAALQILRAVEQAQRALKQYTTTEADDQHEAVELPLKLSRTIESAAESLAQLREAAHQVVVKARDAKGEKA